MGAAPSTQNRPGSRMSSYPGARPQMQHNPSWRPPNQASSGNRSSSGTATINGPGAYSISRNATGSPQLYRVTIPPNIRPNQEFQVYGKLFYISSTSISCSFLVLKPDFVSFS